MVAKIIFSGLITSTLLLIYSCSSSTSSVKYYGDYSLIKGEGINELKHLDKTEYLKVIYRDSSCNDIFLYNFKGNFIEKVISKTMGNIHNYQIIHRSAHMGALFCSFKDSSFKFYGFGFPIENKQGPIECFVTIGNTKGLKTYTFLVKAVDTINLIEKLDYFDTLFLSPQSDSNLAQTKLKLKVYNLKSMVNWLSGK